MVKGTKGKIKNERYKLFLNGYYLDPIDRKTFEEMLSNITDIKKKGAPQYAKEARVLCIILWTSGGRPNEVLRLKAGDISKEGQNIQIKLPGSKRGNPRHIILPGKDALINEIWEYSKNKYPLLLLFRHFYSDKYRSYTTKLDKKTGGIKRYEGHYPLVAGNFCYHFKRWFGIPPYFFRHSRMTTAAEKLSIPDLMQLKGSKTEMSVMPYLHATKKQAKKIGKELVK